MQAVYKGKEIKNNYIYIKNLKTRKQKHLQSFSSDILQKKYFDENKIVTLSVISTILLLTTAFLIHLFKKPSSLSKTISNVKLVDDNFSINAKLYRGSQIKTQNDAKWLKENNISMVIDLRQSNLVSEEKQLLQAYGIIHQNIEMNSHKRPTKSQIKQIFQMLEKAKENNQSVYIHCKQGIDRTGIICAIYQIEKQNFSNQNAYKSMVERGYNWIHRLPFKAKDQLEFLKTYKKGDYLKS